MEKNQKEKLEILVLGIISENPDIIALQEVNQTQNEMIISPSGLYHPCKNDTLIKKDNYANLIINKLKKYDIEYYWTWVPVKRGYEKFDEGLAILTKCPIKKSEHIIISKTKNYNNWKKRIALGVEVNNYHIFCLHMGWFDDLEDPFINQWEILNNHIKKEKNIFLMGDFNSNDRDKGKGYDLIKNSGWYDCYNLAKKKDFGYTVTKNIDGWKNKEINKMRIDYIFTNKNIPIKSSYTIFNGINHPIVSDHFGVIVEF